MGVNILGTYLRMQRMKRGLSLSDVQTLIGIDASRLCRIELGKTDEPSPFLLKTLSTLYEVDLVYLFIIAGYLHEDDISEHSMPFKNYESLNTEERNFVQQTIDYFACKNQGKDT